MLQPALRTLLLAFLLSLSFVTAASAEGTYDGALQTRNMPLGAERSIHTRDVPSFYDTNTNHAGYSRRAAPAKGKTPPKKAAAAAPKKAPTTTINKTDIKTTKIDKSNNNNSNMSGNSGVMNNSGNTISQQNNCNVAVNKARDLLPYAPAHAQQQRRDANTDWLNAGMNFQLSQQKLQNEQVAAMNTKCVCNCKRGPSSSYERRSNGVSMGDSHSIVMRAVLEPSCSIRQSQTTGQHLWAGSCATSTVGGMPITQVMQGA